VHRWHPFVCAAAVVPLLALIAVKIIPPVNNVLWTFATLICAWHAAIGARLDESFDADTMWGALRRRGVLPAIIAGGIMYAVGYALVATLGTFVIFLALARSPIRAFLHGVGAQFA